MAKTKYTPGASPVTPEELREYVKQGKISKYALEFLDKPKKETTIDKAKASHILEYLTEHATGHDEKDHGNWARGISHEPGEIQGEKKPKKDLGSQHGKAATEEDFKKPPVKFGDKWRAAAKKEHLEIADRIIDELPEDKKKQLAEVEKKIAEGTPTDQLYRDEEGNWTPERAALHDKIVEEIMGTATPVEGVPEVVITGGLPGAGKSTVLKQRGEEFSNFIHLDSDRIKGMLPEYEGWNAGLLHEESSLILERIMEKAIEGNYNVIYDATLKTYSSAEEIVRSFEDLGYNSRIIFADVPMETAMHRAINRFFGESGRYVPLHYLATHDQKNVATLNGLKDLVDEWEHWDTSGHNEPPKLIGSSHG